MGIEYTSRNSYSWSSEHGGLIHRIPDAHAHKNDILAKYMVILPVNVGDYFAGII